MASPIDMVYIIDTSRSTSDKLIIQMKEYVEKELESHNKGSPNLNVAIVNYGSYAVIVNPLTPISKFDRLNSSLSALTKVGGERQIHKALRKAYTDILRGTGTSRAKHVVLFVAGQNGLTRVNELSLAAQSLRDSGADLTVVAIGNRIDDDDLDDIGGNVIKLPNGDSLPDIIVLVSGGVGASAGNIFYFHVFYHNHLPILIGNLYGFTFT